MRLSQKITAELDHRTGGSTLVEATDGRYSITLAVRGEAGVGVALDWLSFAALQCEAYSEESLRAWGERIASRLSYLMEPLAVVEVDPIAGEVEMRSQSPTTRGETSAFYVVRLSRDLKLRLCRVTFDTQTGRRDPGVCQFTIEAIERLIDDLISSTN